MYTSVELRLAAATVITKGQDEYAVSAALGIDNHRARQMLQSPEFHALLADVQRRPQQLLPSHAELYAMLIHEAKTADKSRDRQNAIERLLAIQGDPDQQEPLNHLATTPRQIVT